MIFFYVSNRIFVDARHPCRMFSRGNEQFFESGVGLMEVPQFSLLIHLQID